MFHRTPSEREWLSWFFVVAWSAFIFVTAPFVRAIVDYVRTTWSAEVFTYGVAVILVIVCCLTAIYLIRQPQIRLINYACLLGIAGLLLYLTFELGARSPSEAVHYVQYGVVSVLAFRAFAHRLRDASIYLASTIVGSTVGMIDETVQWLIPDRYFAFSDMILNFTAVALIQLAIATGIRPRLIDSRISAASLSRLCKLAIGPCAYLGLCLLNTPQNMAWYSERLPLPAFVHENDEAMAQYGYLYEDPEIGTFRSRLNMTELRSMTTARAREGAQILDRYQTRDSYSEFLDKYPYTRDPLLHEARVHLFRRDVYLEQGDSEENADVRQDNYSIAYWENRILEKYFGPILAESHYIWPKEIMLKLERQLPRDALYESAVGDGIITQFNERQAFWFFVVLVTVLGIAGQYFSLRARQGSSTRVKA